jgi:endonuclease/exonuclease/phosphatase family metal-dependent hydrolase
VTAGAGVALVPCDPHATSERLAGWRANVGSAVAYDPPGSARAGAPVDLEALAVLSWNVWIGRGRLGELIARVRDGAFASLGIGRDLPLVVLVQEAFRTDDSVPSTSNGLAAREVISRVGGREDIVETAWRLGLHLRYSPSMRNRADRSDRGNAILSTLPLDDARGIELPLVLQRRVAVTAGVGSGDRRLALVSAHLEPRGPIGYKWLGAAGRAQQIRHLLDFVAEDDLVVLGADLNLGRGRAEPTWRSLVEAGFAVGVPPTPLGWRHTYHALPRLVLDYILTRDRAGVLGGTRVHRLDENPADRGPAVFGSDHHPLLARLDLR